jgi:hypothetical protein
MENKKSKFYSQKNSSISKEDPQQRDQPKSRDSTRDFRDLTPVKKLEKEINGPVTRISKAV